MSGQLFANSADFMASVDKGMKFMLADESIVVPSPEDLDKLKSLFAIFITATMQMDPNAHLADDFETKTATVRMALLAYNLGKNTERANILQKPVSL